MFGKYLGGDYDLAASYVIGDRATDIKLAENLGCKGILLDENNTWAQIAEMLRKGERSATVSRNTKETKITVTVDLDGRIDSRISTGLNFFDHMLDQIAHHSGVALQIDAKGDLQVDEHHTMEDVAIALGEAIRQALGNKRGIGRYGFALPMDECEAMVLMDLGGRIDFSWEVPFTREYVGDTPTEMFRHFYKSLCEALQCNLHIRARGENNHHLAEAVFKAFARTLRQAVACNPFDYELPSSKGML
jgi:imidazoleglycerol-phosphate dehydratase/histidinol-phosphatase